MAGHHLILGKLTDFLTGEILDDTLDERYRQKIARWLVEQKGYDCRGDRTPAESAAAGRSSTRRNQNRLCRPAGRKGRHGHPVRTGFAGFARAPDAGRVPAGGGLPSPDRRRHQRRRRRGHGGRIRKRRRAAAWQPSHRGRSCFARDEIRAIRLKPVAPAARGHGSSGRLLLRGRRRLPVRRHDMPAS
ncbi:MAG: hypothetical protein MZU91_00755 [Desulfosudis oleivorans]|nr:hypothetical protein [Desulfosudis oleivorans]